MARCWHDAFPRLFHFRTQAGQEVDVVLEMPDGRLAGVEVKASASASANDFKGLKALAEMTGDRFVRDVVLYSGAEVVPFGPRLTAVPLGALWSGASSDP